MTTYVEYILEDGGVIYIQAPKDEKTGIAETTFKGGKRIKADKSFEDALKSAKQQAKQLIKELDDLAIEEAEVKFGLVTTGELGFFAIGKVGTEINYEVTLKWKSAKKSND